MNNLPDLQWATARHQQGVADGKRLMVLTISIALLACGVGLLGLTPATIGVGAIAMGCVFAIFARMAQAAIHFHRQMLMMLPAQQPAPAPTTPLPAIVTTTAAPGPAA